MRVFNELESLRPHLNGTVITREEEKDLVSLIPSELLSPCLIPIMQKFPIAGVCFSLNEEADQSSYGVELKWLHPKDILEEATLYYPGISVLNLGYVPIGSCLEGSGDPYFLKMNCQDILDPPLVRIPHDCVSPDDSYQESKIEIVSDSLSLFLHECEIE